MIQIDTEKEIWETRGPKCKLGSINGFIRYRRNYSYFWNSQLVDMLQCIDPQNVTFYGLFRVHTEVWPSFTTRTINGKIQKVCESLWHKTKQAGTFHMKLMRMPAHTTELDVPFPPTQSIVLAWKWEEVDFMRASKTEDFLVTSRLALQMRRQNLLTTNHILFKVLLFKRSIVESSFFSGSPPTLANSHCYCAKLHHRLGEIWKFGNQL